MPSRMPLGIWNLRTYAIENAIEQAEIKSEKLRYAIEQAENSSVCEQS